jgi:hypothetical protein
MDGCCETPMAEHVARFWKLLAEGQVRVLVETHHEGCGGHWNSSSFPDDVAKAIAADRRETLEALKGVVAVSDRKTDEYDRAHAALARAEGA